MSKLPLAEGVLNYIKENNMRLCMPGHKGGKGFKVTDIGNRMYENFILSDITEVPGLDNLSNPEGIIKEAQEKLAKFYKSLKSYFLVNGSTSGNLTMVFSAFNEGDKVIVERNCHKSIFNGIILRKLKPVYIRNKINPQYNAPLSIDEEHFLEMLEENKDAKGIIITYPNYYGICCDLDFIIKEAKKRDMKVLVDAAHGAHFGINKRLPKSPVQLGADMVVMSCHKTLPSLTQTAYLHINDKKSIKRVEFYLKMFLSTSPSYVLMCSMDYARFYLEEKGKEDYDNLIDIINIYREKINRIPGIHIIGKEDLKEEKVDIDITRYVINLKSGYSGYKLSDYLRKNKIQAEMNDNQNVVLIFSPFNNEEDFERLYNVLKNCPIEILKDEYYHLLNYDIPKAELMPCEVLDKDTKLVGLKQAKGKVCAEPITPYPPGIPLITLGEIIDDDSIKLIEYYCKLNMDIIGLKYKDGEPMVTIVDFS